jgi:epoxide hydrolase 4
LAPHFRVVAPDLRGYNESDKPEGVAAYAMPVLIEDVAGLIRAFGEREAIIVGHDWGGGLAWAFAMERPEMTRRLVVMNCPHLAMFQHHLSNNPRQLLKSWYMFFFQIPWLPETLLGANHAAAIGNAFRSSVVNHAAFTDEDIRILRDAAAKPGALHSAVNYYRAVFRGPQLTDSLPAWVRRFWLGDVLQPATPRRRTLADWPRIACPTLLIWGEQDVALNKELTYGMEPLFSGPFRIQYIADSGHWVQQEQAGLVNQYLLEFVGDLVSPSTASSATAPPAGS